MKCPVCQASYRPPAVLCRRCGVDLSALIALHDRAIRWHRQALHQLQAGHYATAIAHNDQAIALHPRRPEFHALAGQLWALQGAFDRAIACWQIVQTLDPQHPSVVIGLALLQQLQTPDESAPDR
jgi:tetratricopeptide (TPR) repeat protein